MSRQIFAAEVSHDDTPLSIREQLAADEATVKKHLNHLYTSVDEVFVLSTCNRFTVYVINDKIDPITEFFAQYPGLKGYVQFYYNTEESITHLFAVASGLLSPIKGDHLVLDQLKQAHQRALECNTIGITLDNLLQEALRIGNRVRTETGIDKFCSSVVDSGIELLYNRLDGLHDKKFLVVGTGKVARLALKYLYNEGIQDVVIVSKDSERARDLAELYYVKSDSIDNIQAQVKQADVIIGCTHYEVALFSEAYLSGFFEHDKVWFILDFGMPRNFNSRLSEHASIELYNLDDLKRLHKSPLDDFGGIEAAWTLVMREAKNFLAVLIQLELSPVLVAYWNRMRYLRNRELNVLLPKLDDQLTSYDIEKIKKQAHKLISNMTGDSIKNTRILANNFQAKNGNEMVHNLSAGKNIKFNISLN
jgi:glutamyl-tRNA reductase